MLHVVMCVNEDNTPSMLHIEGLASSFVKGCLANLALTRAANITLHTEGLASSYVEQGHRQSNTSPPSAGQLDWQHSIQVLAAGCLKPAHGCHQLANLSSSQTPRPQLPSVQSVARPQCSARWCQGPCNCILCCSKQVKASCSDHMAAAIPVSSN